MDFFRISCLMVTGLSVTGSLSETLFQATKKLFHSGKKFARINEKDCEGRIRTDYHSVQIGSLCGIKFEATMDLKTGTGKISFFIPEDELMAKPEDEKDYSWIKMGNPERKAQNAYLN